MKDSVIHTFKGREITVQELTVKQVREVFGKLEKSGHLFIDELLDQPVPALIVSESTGVSIEDLEDSKPSDVSSLIQKVVEVNPSCASMINRRVEAVKRMEHLIGSGKN